MNAMAVASDDWHIIHNMLFVHFDGLVPSIDNYELIVRYAQVHRQPFAELSTFFRTRQNWQTWYTGLRQKLVQAVINNHVMTVGRLFHIGIRPGNITAHNGQELLPIVCGRNKVEMAKLFVRKGHALDNMSPERKLALVVSCVRLNYIEMVGFLVGECNICVRNACVCGDTALVLAVKHAYVEMATLLLPHSGDIDQLHGGQTLLHLCIRLTNNPQSNRDMMRMLLQSGANPQVLCRQGESPLEFAVRHQSEVMVNELLDGGAEIEHVNSTGNTAFLVAVNHGYVGMTKLLLRRGANALVANTSGETARFIAEKFRYSEILQCL